MDEVDILLDTVHCIIYADYHGQPSTHTGEWVLTDITRDSELGTEQKIQEKKEIWEKEDKRYAGSAYSYSVVLLNLYQRV